MDVRHLSISKMAPGACIQKFMNHHFRACTLNVMGLSVCPLFSVSLCLIGRCFPREAGSGPTHDVMPNIDIGFKSANRSTVLGMESIAGLMSCGG